ncbi:MAG TPA: hypothetical protein VEI97_18745, partial [bacterium]|nr:hypothetical protein [bacterium]
RHRHPFPAPNVAQPATASNRCDLSYTGRLVVLAQGPTQSFFGGEVQADPSLVIDPDGFVRPGGLLRSPAPPPHNTFPYLLLVDEAKDNRVGLSNGGNHTGNYVPSFGWQTGTLGPNGTGWYGYDYFHAGQETDLRLVLRRERLTTPARVPLALLIKYTDPRGAGGRTHRFPAAPPDIAQFCYRLPYAALDVSSLRIVQPIALSDVNGTAEVVAAVRDWDASAQESSDHDLSDEGDPKKIQPGAAGAPLLQLDAPRIGDTIQLLPEGGSGVPADPLIYRGTLSNTAGATAGMYVGMLQAVDPEDGDAQAASYRFGLDPHTLAPSPDRALEVRTFQAVPITVQFTGPEILSVSPTGVIGALSDMVTFRAVTTNSPTQWIWEFDGGTVPGSSTEETPTVELFSAGTFSGSLTVGNAAGFSEPFEFSYTILAEAQPGWGLAWGGSRQEFAHEVVASPAGDVFFGGSMSWSGIWQEPIDIDPTPTEDIRQINNDFDAYAIRLGPQGDYRWGLLAGGDWDDIMYDGQHDQVRGMALDWDRGALVLTGQYCGENVDFDPGPGTAGTPPPLGTHWSFLAKYDLDGNLVWLKNWGSDEPYVREDFGQDVALDPAGNLYVLGSCRAGADMDPGLGQTVAPGAVGDEWQVFLSKFDPQGNLLWCRFWETFYAYNYDASLHVSGADLVIASTYNNFVTPRFDLDPGPGELIGPESEDPRSWLVKLDLGGTFAGGWTWGGGDGIASARAVARDTAANIFVTGSFCCGGVDFDPGPGQEVRTPHDGSDGYVLALGP